MRHARLSRLRGYFPDKDGDSLHRIAAQIVKLAFVCGLMIPVALAQTFPLTLHYRGQLSTAAGVPISATVSINFSIYAASTGGPALWSETQSVAVSRGIYDATLGQTVPLTANLFNASLFFGVKVGSDAEMIPRFPFHSTPYSLQSSAIVACSSGITNCGGACVNLANNSNHCGACGNVCTGGHSCLNKVCQ